ncbi:MAG TPA: NYN domain-containing protein [Actinomycetota bacterium]|jgi:predicted RNA-binding protein with PIN domain/predicted  nucleic acid-binding Zn-ribbon protein
MASLPPDVAATVVRAVGAYIRATSAAELPPKLKRFKSFDRPRSLAPHKDALLDVLDDDVLTRARISEWMSDGRPPLSKDERGILALAVDRPDGWAGSLAAYATKKERPRTATKKRPADDAAVAREKERTARAKEETRRVREEARDEVRAARARAADLEKQLATARTEAQELRARVAEAEKKVTTTERAAERIERKARAAAEKAVAKEKAAREELRAARRELESVRRELRHARERLERASKPTRPAPKSGRTTAPRPRAERRRLHAPKGRLETDPQTLDEWLSIDGVQLLVDGYNVTKAEGGFGGADLETQRRRLIEGVGTLARKKGIRATIVFDGSDVAPGTSRGPRAPVKVEYSRSETADDHLVARLESLSGAVVVTTNDKELQHRAAALGATIATSNQLLALIR